MLYNSHEDRVWVSGEQGNSRSQSAYAWRPTVWTEMGEPTTYQRPMTIFSGHVLIVNVTWTYAWWSSPLANETSQLGTYISRLVVLYKYIIIANLTWWTFTKIKVWVSKCFFLVLAHPGLPGYRAIKRVKLVVVVWENICTIPDNMFTIKPEFKPRAHNSRITSSSMT